MSTDEHEIIEYKRILAVDDHEMTTLGYKYILEAAEFDDYKVMVDTCKTFDDAKSRIEQSAKLYRYDIFLLDIQLFGPEEKDARSGEDLGILARKVAPDTKVVFMSSFGDAYRILNICKTTDPDGYLVKSEIDKLTLIAMVKKVLENPPYYTAIAMKALRNNAAYADMVSEQDKKLLYYLAKGVRVKELHEILSVSAATINTRKRHLKSLFGIEHGNDLALIEQARERGFL